MSNRHWKTHRFFCLFSGTIGDRRISIIAVSDVSILSVLMKIIIIKRACNWAWFSSFEVERRRWRWERGRTQDKLVTERWPLSSLSPYHFLSFSLFLSTFLLLTTVCRRCCCMHLRQAYALKMFSSSFANERAFYFRTSNYRNNKHTHCCHATEPMCCCAVRGTPWSSA